MFSDSIATAFMTPSSAMLVLLAFFALFSSGLSLMSPLIVFHTFFFIFCLSASVYLVLSRSKLFIYVSALCDTLRALLQETIQASLFDIKTCVKALQDEVSRLKKDHAEELALLRITIDELQRQFMQVHSGIQTTEFLSIRREVDGLQNRINTLSHDNDSLSARASQQTVQLTDLEASLAIAHDEKQILGRKSFDQTCEIASLKAREEHLRKELQTITDSLEFERQISSKLLEDFRLEHRTIFEERDALKEQLQVAIEDRDCVRRALTVNTRIWADQRESTEDMARVFGVRTAAPAIPEGPRRGLSMSDLVVSHKGSPEEFPIRRREPTDEQGEVFHANECSISHSSIASDLFNSGDFEMVPAFPAIRAPVQAWAPAPRTPFQFPQIDIFGGRPSFLSVTRSPVDLSEGNYSQEDVFGGSVFPEGSSSSHTPSSSDGSSRSRFFQRATKIPRWRRPLAPITNLPDNRQFQTAKASNSKRRPSLALKRASNFLSRAF